MQRAAAPLRSTRGITFGIAFPVLLAAFVLGAFALIPACSDYGNVTLASQDDGGNPDDLRARGVGEVCNDGLRCRAGLTCAMDGKCAPAASLDSGAACLISAECKQGLYCNAMRVCAPAG